MRRGEDEIDGAGDESGVPGAHQLLSRFAFASAIDDRLAASRKRSTGAARAGLIIFSHVPQLTQFLWITQMEI